MGMKDLLQAGEIRLRLLDHNPQLLETLCSLRTNRGHFRIDSGHSKIGREGYSGGLVPGGGCSLERSGRVVQ